MRVVLALFLALEALPASSGVPGLVGADSPGAFSAEELLGKIRKNRIDASQVYKVRDLRLTREDVRFYFTDGRLGLLEPLEGRVTGAIFVGEGELLVMPPDPTEKRNLARFTGAPVLNEKFSSAYLRFTDDTGARLLEALRSGPSGPAGPEEQGQERVSDGELLEQWNSVVQNLNLMYDLRVLGDLVSSSPQPFFAARVSGQRLGAFDLGVDFRMSEQVLVGQSNWKEGRRYQDVWCSFPARSVRTGGMPQAEDPVRPTAYRIAATIRSDRELEVSAEVEFEARASGDRLVSFELSRFLRLAAVESLGPAGAGGPLRYFQTELKDEADARRRSNDLVAVLLPEPLKKGQRYRMQFRYGGEVISDAGRGVLFVGARGSWYPNRNFTPVDFDLTFRYPRRLRLVATGNRVEQHQEGEWRVSRWKSSGPIRVAGFNIGDYEEAQAKAADGTVVEVYANRALEPALEAQRPATVVVDPQAATGLPGRRRPAVAMALPPPPSPAFVAAQIARDTAQALDFFGGIFGPLPFGRLAISPIPGSFGQGWPGLVYLSTSSFLFPFDSARRPMPQAADLFYRTLLRDHELAHQWWGHVVTPATYRDEWITEALSSYAALLSLENQGRSGQRQMRLVLERHREDLLARKDDQTGESAGPPILGFRLISSRAPQGAELIFYKKGPWIIHMLRELMRDPKTGSDAAFFRFLRAVREEFSGQQLTTSGFRALAEKFVLPELNADSGASLEWFFDQWVYGTGIPEVRLKASVETLRGGSLRRPRTQVTGTAALEGVDDSWVLPVPIYAQTARGEVFVGTALAAAEQSKFILPLSLAGQRAVADPQRTLLAVWKD